MQETRIMKAQQLSALSSHTRRDTYEISTGLHWQGVRGGAVGWGTSLQARKVADSIPDGVVGIFLWHNTSGYGVDSAYNRNECQEYSLGG